MKKRSLSILFGLIMVIALIPATVFADTGYGLYVNGEPFTSEKPSIKCGDGTATYDPRHSDPDAERCCHYKRWD